tara:strand:- start:1666 stop:1896 length:231 start_codon:yes stop_codon:yes gene_type:complete
MHKRFSYAHALEVHSYRVLYNLVTLPAVSRSYVGSDAEVVSRRLTGRSERLGVQRATEPGGNNQRSVYSLAQVEQL